MSVRVSTSRLVHHRLLGAHVGGSADELLESSEDGFIGQTLAGGRLGDAEINEPWTASRAGFADGDKNIRTV